MHGWFVIANLKPCNCWIKETALTFFFVYIVDLKTYSRKSKISSASLIVLFYDLLLDVYIQCLAKKTTYFLDLTKQIGKSLLLDYTAIEKGQ